MGTFIVFNCVFNDSFNLDLSKSFSVDNLLPVELNGIKNDLFNEQ